MGSDCLAIQPVRTVASLKSKSLVLLSPARGNVWPLAQGDGSGDPFVPHLQNHVWEDVNLHNSGLPPLALQDPECLGLLHRLHGRTDVWVQHYCVLKDGCLYFYAGIRSSQASGMDSTRT